MTSLRRDTGHFQSWDSMSSVLFFSIVEDQKVQKAQLWGLSSAQHGKRAALPGASWACRPGASCLFPFHPSLLHLFLSKLPSSMQTYSRPFILFLSWLCFPFLKSDSGIREGVPLEEQRIPGNKGEIIPLERLFSLPLSMENVISSSQGEYGG